MASRTWSRLIRYRTKEGLTNYGEAILPEGVTNLAQTKQARVIRGNPFVQHVVTDDVINIDGNLKQPIMPRHCGTVRCLGLNYAKHAHESNMPIPKYPILFYKPSKSLSGPFARIPIPQIARESEGLDYECELVVVIGKRCYNVSEADALQYVAGYTVGNDISHRDWQFKRGGGQWGLGKGFDGWAPFGPGIVSSEIITDPQNLRITTKINGELRQDENTKDMIFSVAKTVAFLSNGTTLVPGDVIFTGTPSGVAMGMKPPMWLKHGDIVETTLEGVGTCKNTVAFLGLSDVAPSEED